MAKWTIYHNPGCSKCREALSLLQAKGIDAQVVEYLKQPPSEEELRGIIAMLNGPPASLVRTKEDAYKQLNFDLNSIDEIVRYLARYPNLIERPIVVKDDIAVVARPLELLEPLF